jgi:hypothetical protein
MSGFYESLQLTANRLLLDKGQSGVYSYTSAEVLDPITGDVSGGVTTEQTVNVVITPFNKREVDGTLIQANDLQALSGEGFEPKMGYQLRVGGKSYEVVSCQQINPAGTPLLYKAQVRL